MTSELGVSPFELNEALEFSRNKVFSQARPQAEPVGIILGGQPATGKSLLIERTQDDRPNLSFVVINGDEFRQYHPRFHEYNQAGEREAANQTQAFANYIGQALLKEAIENRYNIIIEGTMRNPDVPVTTAQMYRQNGYSPEAHVLAVNYHQSLQGIYSRYEQQKEIGSSGRFTPLSIHQEAVEGVLKSVDRLYAEQSVDRIAIYNRGAKTLLQDYTLENDQWSLTQQPSTVIEQERNRRWTPAEVADYAVSWERIMAMREKRGAEADPLPQQSHQQVMKDINEMSVYFRAYQDLKEKPKNRGLHRE